MNNWKSFFEEAFEKMGFSDYKIDVDEEHGHGSIFIHDPSLNLSGEKLAEVVSSINHLVQTISQKNDQKPFVFDVNNYRKERESLLIDLAKAAARKSVATKEPVSLPAMNSYERRLIHVELATHPEVETESHGMGKERFVKILPIKEE